MLNVLKLYFLVVGSVFPKYAAQTALKLFATPKKRKQLNPSAQAIFEDAKTFTLTTNNNSVAGYRWGTGSRTVLLVHGWDSRAIDFYKIINAINKDEHQIFSFDAPAHGYSPGSETNILEFKSTIDQLVSKFKINHFDLIIGHSMGGAALMMSIANNSGIHCTKAFLLSTPSDLTGILKRFVSYLRIPNRVATTLDKLITARLQKTLNELSLNKTPRPRNINDITLIHDIEDKVIPYADAQDLANKWKVPVIETKGVNHYTSLKDTAILDLLKNTL